MQKVAKLLNAMISEEVISDYAVFGAVAQMRYTEAVATLDADILVAVPDMEQLDVLTPLYEFCADRGYHADGESIRVGNWPVQFIPAFDEITRDALQEAEEGDIDGVPLRVVRADYLAAIALSVGRAKDHARVLALLENDAVTIQRLEQLCVEYGLSEQWSRYRERFLND